MKKLFKNYSFEFTKNERKILTNFCKQVVRQLETDNKYFADVKAYNSVIEKLNEPSDSVKLTKDEYTRLSLQLKQNIKYLKDKYEKSWFLKKWLLKSVYVQYNNIFTNYFSE